MCDTMVALGNSTADGRVLFAKNSDRQPNEYHLMIRVPHKRHPKCSKIKCTYIEIEQIEETYEVLLLKPFWIWGAEMGCNEHGLNIGNEAVFTKEPYNEDSLIGMDMLRIALERCKTSREAVDLLVQLLDQYGQGGNCGYQKQFTYHNSFLIADRNSAWVLETAGIYWAALHVKDIYSISNRLTIGNEYDLAHPKLVEHAMEKGWCKGEHDFDFSRCYGNPLITRLSGAIERQSCSSNMLLHNKGNITIDTLKSILRSHTARYEKKPFSRSSLNSTCMHGGFLYGDHTTGSYIASLGEPLDTYWVTGQSTPCLSLFKPLWLIDGENLTYSEDETDDAISYWKAHEELHRCVLEHRISTADYIKERDQLEQNLSIEVNELNLSHISSEKLLEIISNALSEEKALLGRYMSKTKDITPAVHGNIYYRHYWQKMNHKLRQD